MLPIVLVLLAVTSALAAPPLNTVSLTAYNINEIGIPSNGVERAFELVDGGTTDVYTMLLQQSIVDLFKQPDALSQSLATTQTLTTLAQLATGIPGDSCAAAAFIDAYVYAVGSGNFSRVRPALAKFISRIAVALDFLVGLANNPESLRNSVGPGSGCAGGGRSYPLEAAWDAILSNSNPYQIGLLNEQYCAVKRMSSAIDSRSNSIAAVITALALPPVNQVLIHAQPATLNLLNVVASGRNPSQAVAGAKEALTKAVSRVTL